MSTQPSVDVSAGTLTVDVNQLKAMLAEIEKMDERLDADSGSELVRKRNLGKTLAEAVKDNYTGAVTELQRFADNYQTDEQSIGFLVGVRNLFNETFNKKIDDYLEKQVKELPPPVKMAEEERKALTEQRKTAADRFRAVREMFSMFGMDVSEIEPPKARTGGRGPRGKRAISNYTWSVDGVRLPGPQDSISGVATQEGYATAKELADAIRAALGKNVLKDPPEEIVFSLKNGKKLVGSKLGSAAPDEDDDEDEDDEETDENNESASV